MNIILPEIFNDLKNNNDDMYWYVGDADMFNIGKDLQAEFNNLYTENVKKVGVICGLLYSGFHVVKHGDETYWTLEKGRELFFQIEWFQRYPHAEDARRFLGSIEIVEL